jgi:lipopolysaccharide biosynthesis glycosyltransferase
MSAASRWEADYIEVKESSAVFHHAALKLCAFDFCDYDNICILDSDTIVRSDAPSIFAVAPEECFCAVKNQQAHYPGSYQKPNVDLARMQIERIRDSGKLVNPEKLNVEDLAANFFNSGVVVVNRQHHALILSYAFHLFSSVPGLGWWDQIPLNVAVQVLHGGYLDMGQMWNFIFPSRFDQMTAYIYHFAGDPTRYRTLDGRVNWRVG